LLTTNTTRCAEEYKEKVRNALVSEVTREGNAQLLDDFVASRFYKRLLKLCTSIPPSLHLSIRHHHQSV
jgi:hypothetical protein